MHRYLLPLFALLISTSPVFAQKISQEKFEEMRAECMAVKQSGAYSSVDHENATNLCISSCPESLNVFNNRALTLCMGAYSSFINIAETKHSAAVPRVSATIDYQGHGIYKVIDTDNVQITKNCSIISLSSAKSYPPPMEGYHMITNRYIGEPITALEEKAVLINVRAISDIKANTGCTAEVIHLRCQPHEADRDICNP